MKLYLVRHGESRSANSDDERPLSEQGKKDIQQLAEFILPLKLTLSRIFHSPKLRAQQTAHILSAAFYVIDGIDIRPELDPLASIDLMLDEITAQNGDCMLVGHMPFMGKLTAKLIAGNEHKDVVLFKTGTIVCLESTENEWIIQWVLSPDLF